MSVKTLKMISQLLKKFALGVKICVKICSCRASACSSSTIYYCSWSCLMHVNGIARAKHRGRWSPGGTALLCRPSAAPTMPRACSASLSSAPHDSPLASRHGLQWAVEASPAIHVLPISARSCVGLAADRCAAVVVLDLLALCGPKSPDAKHHLHLLFFTQLDISLQRRRPIAWLNR